MTEQHTPQTDPPKRLYRSQRERVFFGVCGGLAEYFEIDPVIIRLLFVFFALAFGSGLLFYVIAIFVIPENPRQKTVVESSDRQEVRSAPKNWNLFVGGILVLFGGLFLLDSLDLIDRGWFNFQFFPWRLFWPLVLILLGAWFIFSGVSVSQTAEKTREWANRNRLFRSTREKMVAGVCGGLASYFNMDPAIVRLLTVMTFIFTGGAAFIAYIIAAVVLPKDTELRQASMESETTDNSR